MNEEYKCDALKSGGPLINHQPAKDLWISCDPISHICVPFTGTHHITNRTKSVKPGKNSFKKKNGKTVISVGNRKFSRFWMMKQNSPLNSSREI